MDFRGSLKFLLNLRPCLPLSLGLLFGLGVVLISASKVEAALSKDKLSNVNRSLLASTQDLRELSDRHLNRLIDGGVEAQGKNCEDVHQTTGSFRYVLQALNSQLQESSLNESKTESADSVFATTSKAELQELKSVTAQLINLSEQAQNECASPQLTWIIDQLREKALSLGFLLQKTLSL